MAGTEGGGGRVEMGGWVGRSVGEGGWEEGGRGKKEATMLF